jgi:hypothetical protein
MEVVAYPGRYSTMLRIGYRSFDTLAGAALARTNRTEWVTIEYHCCEQLSNLRLHELLDQIELFDHLESGRLFVSGSASLVERVFSHGLR